APARLHERIEFLDERRDERTPLWRSARAINPTRCGRAVHARSECVCESLVELVCLLRSAFSERSLVLAGGERDLLARCRCLGAARGSARLRRGDVGLDAATIEVEQFR